MQYPLCQHAELQDVFFECHSPLSTSRQHDEYITSSLLVGLPTFVCYCASFYKVYGEYTCFYFLLIPVSFFTTYQYYSVKHCICHSSPDIISFFFNLDFFIFSFFINIDCYNLCHVFFFLIQLSFLTFHFIFNFYFF